MAGAYFSVTNSQNIATGTSGEKGILSVKAPAGVGMRVNKNPTISFDGTSATDAKIPVKVYRGGTDGTGTSVTPAAKEAHNPGSVTAPTAKEDYAPADIPTGSTCIFRDNVAPYRDGFPLPIQGLVLAPGELLWVSTNSSTAKNATVNFPELEV